MAYQHAFLQNAVAQNMQIQQQLMMQNQALSQLLQQTSISTAQNSMSPQEGDVEPVKPGAPVYFGMSEAHRRASETHLNVSQGHSQMDSKPRSKTAPNTPKHSTNMPPQAPQLPPGGPMDAYTRARTVRIGKWRWPPPKEDGDALAEGFFQFKMRKMKQRDGFEDQGEGAKNESFETSGEIQGLDWGELDEEFNKGLKRSQSKDSFTIMEDTPDSGDRRGQSKSPTGSTGGNVGKLKISNEMKEKLEAAMGGSRKSSVASRKSSRGELDIPGAGEEPEHAVKKLNENRKMLLQQKLGGGGKLKKWENIDDQLHHRASDENHGSRKSSHESQGNIPAPPPPPIAPSFNKPLHVQTDVRASTSPVSSFYSPGRQIKVYFVKIETVIICHTCASVQEACHPRV